MNDPNNDEMMRLTIPADLPVAAAEECRQSLITDLSRDARPLCIGFAGEERVGVVAVQLALAAVAAARASGRPAEFSGDACIALKKLGLEG